MEKNVVCFVKKLKHLGYSQKEITIITHLTKSNVSRIWNNQVYDYYKSDDYIFEPQMERNKSILDTIKLAKEIPGVGSLEENDKSYIRLLKHCQVPYDKIKSIYNDRPAREIRNIWSYGTDIKLYIFDSTLIDIPRQDYLAFLGQEA